MTWPNFEPCFFSSSSITKGKRDGGYIIGFLPGCGPLYYVHAPEDYGSQWYALLSLYTNGQYKRYRFRAVGYDQALRIAQEKLESLFNGEQRRDSR